MAAKKKAGGKSKAGQPSNFKNLSPRIPLLARRGFTDKEIAEVLGITDRTLDNWKKAHPEFFRSLNDWKYQADKDVERSLYERACGYEHPEVKVFNNGGEIVTHEVVRHYPPDSTAMIFWLKNRKRDVWRDRTELEHSFETIEDKLRAFRNGGEEG